MEPSDQNDGVLLQLVHMDYGDVSGELRDIQKCRSDLFIRTVTTVAAASLAAGAAKFSNRLGWEFSFYAFTIGTILLTIGILGTIEKARAINQRKGFLASLTDFLRYGKAPRGYRGWSHLRQAISECGARRGREPTQCIRKIRNHTHCWEEGKNQARTEFPLTFKKMAPSMLDSFTSLVTWVYALTYIAVITGLGLSIFFTISSNMEHPEYLMGGLVGGGIVLALVCVGGYYYYQLRQLRKGRHSFEAYYYTYRHIIRDCISLWVPKGEHEEFTQTPEGEKQMDIYISEGINITKRTIPLKSDRSVPPKSQEPSESSKTSEVTKP